MTEALRTEDDGAQALVVLVPGLWMPAWVMIPLARQLAQCGYTCVRFGYASARGSLDDNARCLAEFIAALGAPRVHLVGHSLGGLLALHTAVSLGGTRIRRIVLAGSPYTDSYAARQLACSAAGRWLLGQTVPQWLACAKPRTPEGIEVGVIAGTVGFGLGMLVAPELPRPHDGVVSVGETPVAGMTAHTQVRISHAAMLVSARVARLVCAFLRYGAFDAVAMEGMRMLNSSGCALDRRRSS